ncbi:MAG TPA: hypoxanthine phosphoribosyltransferase [Methylomirabilota bacterium]|nr:hypoxanthine phosphoribosyltransferase [Methylomirabilota bacterium]
MAPLNKPTKAGVAPTTRERGPRRSKPPPKRMKATAAVPVPARWREDISQVLIPEPKLARRIKALAREIQRDFAREELVVVPLLTGTIMFLADLLREISLPCRLDFMGVSSYREGTSSGELVFTKELRLDVRGREVLVVDDILDTGKTLHVVTRKLRELGARNIRICVLLEKQVPRTHKVQADYVGFRIPNLFVVGYGLDYAERYRNLPFVGVLKPERYE